MARHLVRNIDTAAAYDAVRVRIAAASAEALAEQAAREASTEGMDWHTREDGHAWAVTVTGWELEKLANALLAAANGR